MESQGACARPLTPLSGKVFPSDYLSSRHDVFRAVKRKLIIAGILALTVIAAVWILYPRLFPREFDRRLSAKTMHVLDNGERFVLFSLDPKWLGGVHKNSKPIPKETFHDYAVLGKTEIKDKKEREELLRALYKGIADSPGTMTGCFEPRHGISATANGETVELVICFQCLSIGAYAKNQLNVRTTPHALPTFNQALEKAGLPVAKDIVSPPVKQGDIPPQYRPGSSGN